MRAAARCYEANPYFMARYAERGEAFSRSDGGYMVTLTSHPLAYVIQQIKWLGVLLASRGMPRWLLESHLDLLYDELSATIPKRRVKYRKLLKAAEVLREARHDWISQPDFETLAAAFAANSGNGLANAGEMLVSAVCDEFCGIAKAVPSLVTWLGDPGRFPAQWCTSVEDTLTCARAVAARNGYNHAKIEVSIGAA
ncbi:hypothetical protein PHAMO_200043 [Magnetospirillum molischianum DSM 120]|uniref:Uncharacterized protein n=1 Tax=Magnetospirillum molischianum DSM 120 TaxID=1150626 RepID=H8FQ20_MAGML|nr:hypothetical protein PHAMO_200043 [Magnetospirillum molischianum DSM 120]